MVDVYICEFLQTVEETTKQRQHVNSIFEIESRKIPEIFCFALFARKVALA